MQTMNQYILPSPALSASYPVENPDTSPTSPATSRTYSWSMEPEPQLFTNDATFWQDVSAFICSSPQNSFDYRSDDFCTSPTSPNNENTFKAPESTTESTQPRVRGQTLELLLKRRAQNRASQRAYRDRRDQHVRELESQYEEMSKRNEALTREHEALRCENEKLKKEQEAWKADAAKALSLRQGNQAEGDGDGEAAGHGDGEGGDGNEVGWRAEVCLSQVLGGSPDGEAKGAEGGTGNGTGLIVKIVVCKRCFGGAGVGVGGGGAGNGSALVKARCES